MLNFVCEVVGIIISLIMLFACAYIDCGYKQIIKYGRGEHALVPKIASALAARMKSELKAKFTEHFVRLMTDPAFRNLPPVVTLSDIRHSLQYQTGSSVFRTSTHIGQRKLFLTELQFFTDYIKDQIAVCVYAGAAPSNHTGYLSKLFPNIIFILVDPNPFDVFEAEPVILKAKGAEIADIESAIAGVKDAVNSRIFIINDLFTMELASIISRVIPHDMLYFVSDIRTNLSTDGESPDATDILWNLSQQYNWMSVMKPKFSMLKFRHPFYRESAEVFKTKSQVEPYKTDFDLSRDFGIDFVANFANRTLTYWDGTINIQAFPGASSTETRLITDGTRIRDWGTAEAYDNKLFYYNNIERCYGHHLNDNANSNLGFDHCNDCALENYLWKRYIDVYGKNGKNSNNVQNYVRALSRITHRPLIRENHGRFFDKYPLEKLLDAVQRHNNIISSRGPFSRELVNMYADEGTRTNIQKRS